MSNTQLYAVKEQKQNYSTQAGENIGYEKGAKMVKNHFDRTKEEVDGTFIGREVIEAMLAQPGAVGITILPGANQSGAAQPVLVAVNAQGNYILKVTSVGANGELQ